MLSSSLRHYIEVLLSYIYSLPSSRLISDLPARFGECSSRPTLLASLALIAAAAAQAAIAQQPKQVSRSSSDMAAARIKCHTIPCSSAHPLFCFVSTLDVSCCPLFQNAHLGEFVAELLHPYLTCNHGHVRLLVQYLYHQLLTTMQQQSNAAEDSESDDDSDSNFAASSSCARSLMQYLSSDSDMCRLRERQAAYFRAFDPTLCCSVRGLLAHGDEAHHFIPRHLLDQLSELQGQYLSALRLQYDDQEQEENAAATATQPAAVAVSSTATDEKAASSSIGNFQQKIDLTPLSQLGAFDALLSPQPGDDTEVGAQSAADASSSSAEGVSMREAVTRVSRQSTLCSVYAARPPFRLAHALSLACS